MAHETSRPPWRDRHRATRPGPRRGETAMATAVDDLLRLAWQADRDGRENHRDALLTLAAAEAPPDAPWLARCRRRLITSCPDHAFSRFPTVAAALADR